MDRSRRERNYSVNYDNHIKFLSRDSIHRPNNKHFAKECVANVTKVPSFIRRFCAIFQVAEACPFLESSPDGAISKLK